MLSKANFLHCIVHFQSPPTLSLHTTSNIFGHWYTKLQRYKPPFTARKNAPTFSFDWEHVRFKRSPSTDLIPGVENFKEFQTLNEEQKKLFTYGFNALTHDYNIQLTNFMKNHGCHPADDSLLAKVLKITFKIWYNKALLEKQPLVISLRGSTESLVQRRMRILRRLRLMNKEDYEKAMGILKIDNIFHLDPFKSKTMSEVDERKQKIRNECYQLRLAKLARMKKDLVVEREAFYAHKQNELQRLTSRLGELVVGDGELSKEEVTRRRLKELFDIVISERRTEALAPTRADSLWWYSKEAVLRRHVIDSMADREAQILKQRRK